MSASWKPEVFMQRTLSKSLFYIGSFLACSLIAMTSGCASGGFHLTREYAGWLNSQNIIVRIVLYVFGFVVFFVTLLVDMVILNTADFWQGRVSAGNYQFKDGDKTFLVHHEFLPTTNLKRSTIQVLEHGKKLQEVMLSETTSGEIEFYIDGKIRTRVRDLHSIPVATLFDEKGHASEEKVLWSLLTSSVQSLAKK
jgi:hypothetical protein